jgi:hypothetical protein
LKNAAFRNAKEKFYGGWGGGLCTSDVPIEIPSFRAFKRDTAKTSNKKFYDSPPTAPKTPILERLATIIF